MDTTTSKSTTVNLPAAFEECSSEEIIQRIKSTSEIESLMNYICNVNGDVITLDYRYFKHIASKHSYPSIINHLLNNIDTVLSQYDKFNAIICVKSLTVSDIDKHLSFIKELSNILKTRYQDKMACCCVHKAPFIFAQIYNIVSCFIDKDTQSKIQLM